MAMDEKRVSGKRVVDGAAIVISETNPELTWLSPKAVIIAKQGQLNFDKYLSGSPFKTFDSDFVDFGNLETDDKDTVHLTDIESITYQSYTATTGELKYRAILKIRNSSKTPDEVIGVDGRTANLEAK